MSSKNNPIAQLAKTLHRQFAQLLLQKARPPKTIKNEKPYLEEREGILALHFDRLSVQSEMDIERPDELILTYTRAMMSFLLLNPQPRQITMIGLGGGSLAKYCYRYLPTTDITVVEINPEVIALRSEFAIPPDDARFKIIAGDGAEYIFNKNSELEVLMVDGFDAGGMPSRLGTQQFYDRCFASLADDGILVVNLWGSNMLYSEYLTRIQQSFANRVVVLEADDSLNKIVVAVKQANFPPSHQTIQQHAEILSASHSLNFHAKSHKMIVNLPSQAVSTPVVE